MLVIMLSGIQLIDIMLTLSATILRAITLCQDKQSVVMLRVILLSVFAPSVWFPRRSKTVYLKRNLHLRVVPSLLFLHHFPYRLSSQNLNVSTIIQVPGNMLV
jgi:hypothetical protein